MNIACASTAYYLAMALGMAATVHAQTIGPEALKPLPSEEHQTRFAYERVQPLLDVPMIDAAITRAPSGEYFLTGTTGKEVSGFSVQGSGRRPEH